MRDHNGFFKMGILKEYVSLLIGLYIYYKNNGSVSLVAIRFPIPYIVYTQVYGKAVPLH